MDGGGARHIYYPREDYPNADSRIYSSCDLHPSENCWTEHYYDQQAAVREKLLGKYAGYKSVEGFIAFGRQEEELYRNYKEFYGYVFYIGKKI